jgi:uncharacterized protein YgiM (DUF1202 family)
MSYTMCPACGQHALKVANRCPRCGLPFEQQFFSRAQPSRHRHRTPIVLLLGTLLVLTLITAEWINRRKADAAREKGRATTRDSVTAIPAASLVTPAIAAPPPDTARRQPSPADRLAPIPVPAAAPRPQVPAAVAAPAPAVPSGDGEVLTATDWVNVRARPSSTAPVVGVLRPGESVTVDSTVRGWYRVRAGRVPAGYIGRGLLKARQ